MGSENDHSICKQDHQLKDSDRSNCACYGLCSDENQCDCLSLARLLVILSPITSQSPHNLRVKRQHDPQRHEDQTDCIETQCAWAGWHCTVLYSHSAFYSPLPSLSLSVLGFHLRSTERVLGVVVQRSQNAARLCVNITTQENHYKIRDVYVCLYFANH